MSAKMSSKFSRKGHELTVVVEAEALEKQAKRASVTLVSPPGTTFIMTCDEGAYLMGDNAAPPPLAFLSSSIGF